MLMVVFVYYYETVCIIAMFRFARSGRTSSFTKCIFYHLYSLSTPREPVPFATFLDLFSQLPIPYLLMGDINGHHPLWGSTVECGRGNMVVKILTN